MKCSSKAQHYGRPGIAVGAPAPQRRLRALFAEHVSPWLGVLADYIRLGKEEGRIWSNLDPEAYLLNTIHQVVSGIAVSEVFTDLYPESEPPASRQALQKRHIEEMVRMAHASLFLPRTPPEKQN